MSNKTDLDWLARNVHVWSEGANYVCVNHTDGGYVFHEHNRNCAIWFTKGQWLARRAELQNKPTEWPKRANWLAQHEDGEWTFYSDSADNPPQHRLDGNWYSDDVAVKCCHSGEVLGDWRDTLEKRPEQDEFETFTSIEGNQEQDMTQQQEVKQDSGWFERGELPPVGVDCIFEPGSGSCYFNEYDLKASGKIVKIIAHTRYEHSSCDVAVFRWDLDGCFGVSTGNTQSFRPIPTERDALIEIIKNTDDTDDKIADAILAAGFSLRGK